MGVREIEKSYHDMLKSVEKLVKKEGKTLREAIDIAEDKLFKRGGLEQEHAKQISAEVQRDLGSLGETIAEAKASFREKWELDSRYLSESAWDTLSRIADSVADKTTLAMMTLNRELQGRIADATSRLHEREHQDHRDWQSDHKMWLDDIAIWQKEYDRAEKDLVAIQSALQQRKEELDRHRQAIKTHEYIDQVHEQDIARSEKDPDNPVIQVIITGNAEGYAEMKARHREDAELHQALAQDHRKVISLITRLHKIVLSR